MALSLLLLGASRVGKTTFLNSHLQRPLAEYDSSVHDDYLMVEELNGQKIEVSWVDIGGDQSLTEMLPSWISKGAGFLIMFNVDDKETLAYAKQCKTLINRTFGNTRPTVLVGNTVTGNPKTRRVSLIEGRTFASQLGLPYFECASLERKSCESVVASFLHIVFNFGRKTESPLSPKRQSTVKSLLSFFKSPKSKVPSTMKKETTKKCEDKKRTEYKLAPKKLFSSPKKEKGRQLSVVLLGAEKVGKTMMLRRYLGKLDTSEVPYDSTIEDEVQVSEKIGGDTYLVNYLDTGGEKHCNEMLSEWISKADACIVVYDPTRKPSFLRANKICEALKKSRKSIPVVVVANKTLTTGPRRQVPPREGEHLAGSVSGAYLETSSRDETSNQAFKKVLCLLGKKLATSPRSVSVPRNSGFARDAKVKRKGSLTGLEDKQPEKVLPRQSRTYPEPPKTPRRNSSPSIVSGFKVAILGSPKVGKSHLLNIHLDRKTENSYDSTIEDRYSKNEVVNGSNYLVEYIDTGGDDACEEMAKGWLDEADAHILVFKTDDRASLDRIKTLRHLSPTKPALVVANSSTEQRKVSRREAQKVAGSLLSDLVEISTESELNISSVFERMATQVIERKRDASSPLGKTHSP